MNTTSNLDIRHFDASLWQGWQDTHTPWRSSGGHRLWTREPGHGFREVLELAEDDLEHFSLGGVRDLCVCGVCDA